MSEQEVISLARTLGVEVPSSLHDETESGETNVAAGGMDTTVSEPNEDLDTAFVADSSIDVTQADDTGANNSTAEAPAENDSSHDDTISAFCSITGAEPSAAQHLLEVRTLSELFTDYLLTMVCLSAVYRPSVGTWTGLCRCIWRAIPAAEESLAQVHRPPPGLPFTHTSTPKIGWSAA